MNLLFICHLYNFQENLQWETKAPLAFQAFTNVNYRLITPTYFWCNDLCTDISVVKQLSQNRIYPLLSNVTRCTLMIISDLAEPDWINIDCNRQLTKNVFCVLPKQQRNYATTPNRTVEALNQLGLTKFCLLSEILNKSNCYRFTFHPKTSFDYQDQFKSELLSLNQVKQFQFLINSISCQFPPLLGIFRSKRLHIVEFSYERHLNLFIWKKKI